MCNQAICPKCGEVIAVAQPAPSCEHCYCRTDGGWNTAGGVGHMICCKCGDRQAVVVYSPTQTWYLTNGITMNAMETRLSVRTA